jgi:hypothetical protein
MSSRRVLASVKQNQANLKRVGILAQQEVRSVLRISNDLTDLQTFSLVRDTIPVIANRYGTVNSAATVLHYNEMRDIAFEGKKVKSYSAVVPALAFTDRVDALLGYGIASNFTGGKASMVNVLVNGITKIVSEYAHQTIQYNAEADTIGTVTVQRVAEPNACAFCAMLAVQGIVFQGIGSPDDFTIYENDWHDNCNCSLETIFSEQSLIRPPYYDKMENTYKEASDKLIADGEAAADELGTSRGNKAFLKENPEYSFTTKNITRYMREVGGLK